MNIIRKMLHFVGLVDLVWLEDYDGEVTLRVKHQTGFKPYAWRLGIAKAVLEPDGTVCIPSYVKRWKPYEAEAQS